MQWIRASCEGLCVNHFHRLDNGLRDEVAYLKQSRKRGATATTRIPSREPLTPMRLGGSRKRGLLLGARLLLVLGLPVLVGHAVDDLARALLGKLQALGVGRLLVPVGEAVAAEAGQIHQVDVLHLAAPAQMLHELAESRGLQFGDKLM